MSVAAGRMGARSVADGGRGSFPCGRSASGRNSSCMLPCAALTVLLVLAPQGARGQGPARALELHDEGYVGSDACRECHAANHTSWHASFHRTMTQAPSS